MNAPPVWDARGVGDGPGCSQLRLWHRRPHGDAAAGKTVCRSSVAELAPHLAEPQPKICDWPDGCTNLREGRESYCTFHQAKARAGKPGKKEDAIFRVGRRSMFA